MDLGSMMKQAQKIQQQMKQIQEELGQKSVEAGAGGGMVTVVANGKQEILSVKIAPEAVDPSEVGMLEDLLTSAVNEALRALAPLLRRKRGSKTTGKTPLVIGSNS